LYVKIIE